MDHFKSFYWILLQYCFCFMFYVLFYVFLILNLFFNSRIIALQNFAGFCQTSTEKALAPHSSTLAWKIPWVEKPGRLQSMGSLRVAHDWATSLSLFLFMYWRRKWQPTPVFLPGESQGWGAWWAAIYGVTHSRTWLKRLSSSSSSSQTSTWISHR